MTISPANLGFRLIVLRTNCRPFKPYQIHPCLPLSSLFKDFLSSEKIGFVLTGKSGVGKSIFVLSLAAEYMTQDDFCYLMYDGTRLSLGGLFLYNPGTRFIVDAISSSPGLQQAAIWILNCTVETDNYDDFIRNTVKSLANLIYGADIFKLPF